MPTLVALVLILAAAEPGRMEFVRVADDGRGFVLDRSGRPFVPWGMNYGHEGKLIEDVWESDWPAVADDFREMKALGANVARVHLQFGKFMDAADRPNPKALERLGRLIALGEEIGLYLDLTGLGAYRKADVPGWYDGLNEDERWAAQARFWAEIARVGNDSPAVFCYDLMNEPIVPGDKREPGAWYSGKPFGGYDFVQFITLDPRGRPREEVARDWIRALTKAIREHDRRHLITVGLLPWTPTWGHLSGFVPATVAPELDFVSVHIYPEKGKVDAAMTVLEKFEAGKPVVIEETFALTCSSEELEDFLRRSRRLARGWMGHYDGQDVAELEALQGAKTITLPQAIYLGWLQMFKRLGPEMKEPTAKSS